MVMTLHGRISLALLCTAQSSSGSHELKAVETISLAIIKASRDNTAFAVSLISRTAGTRHHPDLDAPLQHDHGWLLAPHLD